MLVTALAIAVLGLPALEDGPTPEKRAQAAKLTRQIVNPELRWRAMTLVTPEPETFDAALELIAEVRQTTTRVQMLRKITQSPKHKSMFARSLTTEEIRNLHECVAVDHDKSSAAGVLALLYLTGNLDRTRAVQSVRLLDNVSAGDWKDTVSLGAIYALTVRKHVHDTLREQKLPLDAKSVPESFLTDAKQILTKIRSKRIREVGCALIAISTLHRGQVEQSLEYLEHIKQPELNDILRFQAVSVLLTNRLDREQSLLFELTPDEVRRFAMAQPVSKTKKSR